MLLPKPRSGVIIQRDAAEVFMIDEERGEVFQVNDSAARIFECCQAQLTVEQAVVMLVAELAIVDQHAEVRADVCAVAKQLVELGLCEAIERESAS